MRLDNLSYMIPEFFANPADSLQRIHYLKFNSGKQDGRTHYFVSKQFSEKVKVIRAHRLNTSGDYIE